MWGGKKYLNRSAVKEKGKEEDKKKTLSWWHAGKNQGGIKMRSAHNLAVSETKKSVR